MGSSLACVWLLNAVGFDLLCVERGSGLWITYGSYVVLVYFSRGRTTYLEGSSPGFAHPRPLEKDWSELQWTHVGEKIHLFLTYISALKVSCQIQ